MISRHTNITAQIAHSHPQRHFKRTYFLALLDNRLDSYGQLQIALGSYLSR